MEIKVKVPKQLASQAQARGLPIEVYVEELLVRQAAMGVLEVDRLETPAQIRTWLDGLAQFSEKIPPLPDLISREWIYQDHD
jgi:hypothetical protein